MKEINQYELIFAKINDKIKFCNSRNKITHTDFFTELEISKIEKYLKSLNFRNYFWNGGIDNSNRKMLFFYPEKLSYQMALTNVGKILNIIRISLPNSQIGTFEHRDYLSAIMKFGIQKEQI